MLGILKKMVRKAGGRERAAPPLALCSSFSKRRTVGGPGGEEASSTIKAVVLPSVLFSTHRSISWV